MKLTHLFTDFEAWVKHAIERGFEGPKQIQGHQQFEFTEAGEKVAHWDGSAGQGTVVKAAEPAAPAEEPAPVPPADDAHVAAGSSLFSDPSQSKPSDPAEPDAKEHS